MDIIWLAISSIYQFIMMTARGQLRLHRQRLGQLYDIEKHGTYAIFRETHSSKAGDAQPVVLVVGFRLKLIRSSRLMHWLFERFCILTTPFWSGFMGFKIKLWMVDPDTKNYLGIYCWNGRDQAQVYVDALEQVLKAVSTSNSVWYDIIDDEPFESYLEHRQA